jgi:hypothetical protein
MLWVLGKRKGAPENSGPCQIKPVFCTLKVLTAFPLHFLVLQKTKINLENYSKTMVQVEATSRRYKQGKKLPLESRL